jgi:hypothetical protein
MGKAAGAAAAAAGDYPNKHIIFGHPLLTPYFEGRGGDFDDRGETQN